MSGHANLIVFRVDASFDMGTGHVMRCLTLAQTLAAEGAECHFICREHPGHLIEMIRLQGFTVHDLPIRRLATPNQEATPSFAHTNWLGATWQDDAEQSREVINRLVPDWVVVDHYSLDKRWEQSVLPQGGRLLVIDDLADRCHECDILLDQNLFSNPEKRYSELVSTSTQCFLGPRYALLGVQYSDYHRFAKLREDPIKRVLVYFGGGSNADIVMTTIGALVELNDKSILVDLVVSNPEGFSQSLTPNSYTEANIKIHGRLPSLAPLITKADLSIGAGGSTVWERLCLGLPSLVITVADNQLPVSAELHSKNLIYWVGHSGDVGKADIVDALKDVLRRNSLKQWSEKCLMVCDGRGAARLSDKMLAITRGNQSCG